MTTTRSKMHQKWRSHPEYGAASAAASFELDMAQQLVEARVNSGLSQHELAKRMGTSQSTIARLESGKSLPSMRTLVKYAHATSCDVQFSLMPKKQDRTEALL